MSLHHLALLAQTTGQAPASSGLGDLAVWAIVLLGLALGLFIIEVFVPTAGILGTISALCAVAGIVLLFRIDTTWGLIGAIITLAALPFALAFAIKIWPHTPLGRALILKSVDRAADEPSDASHHADAASSWNVLVGQTGKTMTDLRPVGTCLINGKRETCLAQTGVIEAGRAIEVVAADGMRITVRPATPARTIHGTTDKR